MANAIAYWAGKIKDYVFRDFDKVLSEELEYLENYKKEREIGLLRAKAREKIYEEIFEKLEKNEDKEIIADDLELFGLTISTIEKEVEKINKKILILKKYNKVNKNKLLKG